MSDLRPSGATDYNGMPSEIVQILESARRAAARSVNALMTATYWEIGRRIVEFEQGGKDRAGYGEVLIERLADNLTKRFGRGFSRQNIWQIMTLPSMISTELVVMLEAKHSLSGETYTRSRTI